VKSFFTLWYKATRPVPKPGSVDPVVVAQKSKQRRLLKRTGAVILALAAGSYGYTYFTDAPKRAHAEMELGVKKMAPGSYSEAIAHFDRAIGISPGLAEAYLNRGVAEHHSNRRAEALADFDKALDLDDHLTRAYNERGQIYLANGDAKKALADFTESLRLKPNLEGYYQRGQVHEAVGQHANAIADFTAGVAEAPDAPYVYRARAAAKRNSGDREGAAVDEAEADRIEGKRK
jgi:tetratricopeptide (TPR) repeat protein